MFEMHKPEGTPMKPSSNVKEGIDVHMQSKKAVESLQEEIDNMIAEGELTQEDINDLIKKLGEKRSTEMLH